MQYNIKKKEEAPEAETQKEPDNPLMRKKKTPEELAKEAEEADQDELTSRLRGTIWFFQLFSIQKWFFGWKSK